LTEERITIFSATAITGVVFSFAENILVNDYTLTPPPALIPAVAPAPIF